MNNAQRLRRLAAAERDIKNEGAWRRVKVAQTNGISPAVLVAPKSKILPVQYDTAGGRRNNPKASINNPSYRGPVTMAPGIARTSTTRRAAPAAIRTSRPAALSRPTARRSSPALSPQIKNLAEIALRDGPRAAGIAARRLFLHR